MGYKVLIPQDIAEEGKEFLISRGYEIKMGSGVKEVELARDVEDCDAMLLRTANVTGAVLRAGKKLRIVARHGAGYNNVDINTATELGIWVTNTPDATTGSVAEFTVGAMIAAGKRFVELRDALKQGDFGYKNKHMGTDLVGKRLGIIGIGKIGIEVAKKPSTDWIWRYLPIAQENSRIRCQIMYAWFRGRCCLKRRTSSQSMCRLRRRREDLLEQRNLSG